MANYVLKIKSKSGQKIMKDLNPLMTIGELKLQLSQSTSIPTDCLQILSGFPPKLLDLSNEKQTLKDSSLCSGDTVIVEENLNKSEIKTTKSDSSVDTNHLSMNGTSRGILLKKVVPADNSCLFTSVGFVINGKVDLGISSYLREVIAQNVAADPETYSEAMLGKPNKEYCDWIMKPESWGGAIEVSILSAFYGIEIAVVDTQNTIINRFGEDKNYGARVFLLFDGIHYDPLYMEPPEGGAVQTIFPSEDLSVLTEAEQLAKEARASRQFTDVNKFTLRCIQCDTMLTGQSAAQIHAKETGHTNFGEV